MSKIAKQVNQNPFILTRINKTNPILENIKYLKMVL